MILKVTCAPSENMSYDLLLAEEMQSSAGSACCARCRWRVEAPAALEKSKVGNFCYYGPRLWEILLENLRAAETLRDLD